MEHNLRKVTLTDQDGRLKIVLLPMRALDEEASRGIPLGPPILEELGLPLETEVRLNNELFHRGIITAADAQRRRPEVIAALQAALKVDAGRIVELYLGRDHRNGKQATAEQPNKTLSNRRPRQPK